MDRTRLGERNRKLAEFQHRLTWREQVRRRLLQTYAMLPSPLVQRPIKGTFLLIRPDHLGDVLLTTPAIQALRVAQPSAKVTALAGAWSAEVLAAYPEIDLVLTVPFPGFTRLPKQGLLTPYSMALNWARKVRQLKVETAIILRPDHWWGALLAYIAGIPNRVGYDLPDVRPFLTRPIPYLEGHAVSQSMKLVEFWTGRLLESETKLRFPVAEEDREYITGLLADNGIPRERSVVVIHPGAGTPIKRWQPENWGVVADRLVERLDAAVVFTGSDAEHKQIWQVMGRMRHRGVSLAGDTNIGQLAALFERARVVLGSDSGPLHLAVACGAPTVHLFGPADPAEFGPWGDPHRQIVLTSDIRCRPCRILDWPGDNPNNHPCIRDITPRQVFDKALQAANLKIEDSGN